MESGYILLHRKIRDWQWYKVDYMYYFFTELLFMANYEDKKWKTITIPRGSFITSWKHLSEKTGLTVQQCRTGVARLRMTKELTYTSTNKYSIITIINYNSYQLEPNYYNKQTNKPVTSQQQQLNKVNKVIKENTNAQFEEFWASYGKKIDRAKCEGWYNKHGNNGTHEKVMAGIKRWRESGKWDDPQYQPYPYTFLFNKRYEDEPPKKLSITEQLREEATRRFLQGDKP